MSTQRTLYVAQQGKLVPWSVPKKDLKEGEVRVKVFSVGINPIDYKVVDNQLADGAGQGHEFAGTIVEVGSGVTNFKVGDTVAGGVAGGNVDHKMNGAFTNDLTIDSSIVFRFPTKLTPLGAEGTKKAGPPQTFEQAASLGVSTITTALAFDEHKPQSKGKYALIYGLTGSVGFVAAQYARNIGYTVIGVSGELDGVTNALEGVTWVSRHDPKWPQKVLELTNGVDLVLDAITRGEETEGLFETVKPDGTVIFLLGSYQVPSHIAEKHKGVKVEHPNFYFLTQEVKKFGTTRRQDPKKTYLRAPEIIAGINAQLEKGQILTLPVSVSHGLDQLPAALARSKNGVRGLKLIVDVE